MADVYSTDKRSEVMAKIRGKNTKPEKIVFSYLKNRKIYFQKHYSRVKGSPDIALPRKKLAIFIDGDFWHGYNLERRKDRLPVYWSQKIIRNVKRDRATRRILKNNGWKVLRVWEHELNKNQREYTLENIVNFLQQS